MYYRVSDTGIRVPDAEHMEQATSARCVESYALSKNLFKILDSMRYDNMTLETGELSCSTQQNGRRNDTQQN